MIKNHLIEIWLMAEIIPIFVVLLFIPSFLGALSVLAIGIISAITLAKVTGETVIYPTNLLLSHLVIYLLAIFGGSILNKAHLLGIETVEKEKSKILLERAQIFKYLAGAIAHELRNPLNTINFIGDQIKSVLVEDFNASTKKKLGVLTSQVSESISEANNIINIILSDLNENPVDARDFVLLKSEDIIPKIIQNYSDLIFMET
jgi:signal transduction histidine kinase